MANYYGGDIDNSVVGGYVNYYGGGGNDFLQGSAGANAVYGGVGNDMVAGSTSTFLTVTSIGSPETR